MSLQFIAPGESDLHFYCASMFCRCLLLGKTEAHDEWRNKWPTQASFANNYDKVTKMKTRKKSNAKSINYGTLEKRAMLAGVGVEAFQGHVDLLIDGSFGDDVAEVRYVSNGQQVEVQFNNQTTRHNVSDFNRIRFLGRNGNDTFVNQTNINSLIIGHHGNDTLTGGGGNNWILGGGGNDELTGGVRNDLLRGGAGQDDLDGASGHDRLFGGDGNDTLQGQSGNDFLSGENGDDTLLGDAGNDRLFGGAGADRLFGGAGNDRGHGGQGNDVHQLGSGTDVAVFDQAFSQYDVGGTTASLTVTSNTAEGVDTVVAAEHLVFSDGSRFAEPTQVESNLSAADEVSLSLANELRAENGLPSLTAANDLNAFSQGWSREMSNTGFRHSTSADRAPLLVGDRSFTGENIVFTSDTSLSAQQAAELFHNLWANSPSHFANLVNSSYTEIGIGLVLTDNGWYGTHVFSNG